MTIHLSCGTSLDDFLHLDPLLRQGLASRQFSGAPFRPSSPASCSVGMKEDASRPVESSAESHLAPDDRRRPIGGARSVRFIQVAVSDDPPGYRPSRYANPKALP
jgi:hypothetical protein